MVETAAAVSVSPVKFGNLGDNLSLPWFNRADAAYSRARDIRTMNVLYMCASFAERAPRIPSTLCHARHSVLRLLTIVLHPDSDTVPTFEIPYAESLSPSTTCVEEWGPTPHHQTLCCQVGAYSGSHVGPGISSATPFETTR